MTREPFPTDLLGQLRGNPPHKPNGSLMLANLNPQ